MIFFNLISSNDQEGSALSYAKIDYQYTVGEFIKTMLTENKHGWGNITVKPNKGKKKFADVFFDHTDVSSCHYVCGRLKSRLKRKILKQNIVSIWEISDYSRKDYIILIDKSTSN